MKTFIVLGFLMAAANAASLGYNYGPGVSSTTVQPVVSGAFISSGNLAGSGSSGQLLGSGNSGLISSGGSYSSGNRLVGSGLVTSGANLLGSGNSGLISGGTSYGSGSSLIGSGSGLVSSGSNLLSSGNSGLVSGGGSYSSGSGLVNSGANLLSSGNSGLISSGGSYSSGGSLIGSGSGLISSGNSGLISNGGSFGSKVIDIGSLDSIPQTVELSKQFFHFSAPEEFQDEGQVTQQLSNVLKKNLQIVFITAPENNAATSAALQLAKQAIEQKTAIYVLTKVNDGSQLVGQIQQIQESVPTVPEVRFIKYRTAEDFAHAKEVIQSQYNNIGGTSEVINGGVAPVLDYASPAKSVSGATLLGSSSLSSGSGIVSNLGSSSGSIIGSGSIGSGIIGSGVVSGLASSINKNVGGVNIIPGATSSSYLPSNPL